MPRFTTARLLQITTVASLLLATLVSAPDPIRKAVLGLLCVLLVPLVPLVVIAVFYFPIAVVVDLCRHLRRQ